MIKHYFWLFAKILVDMPYLAFVVALIPFFVYLSNRSTLPLIATIAWVGYGVYEYGVYLRIFCTGNCAIRPELLLIYPALMGFTLFAVVFSYRWHV